MDSREANATKGTGAKSACGRYLFAPVQRAISAAAGYGENEVAILIDFFTRHHKEAVAATAELQTVRPGKETAAGPAKAVTQFDKSSPSGRPHRRPRLGSPEPG